MTHLWFLFSLQRGGYPFGKDDLSLEEWHKLGLLRERINLMSAGVKGGKE